MKTQVEALQDLLAHVREYYRGYCASPDESATYHHMILTIDNDIKRTKERQARLAKLAAKA